MTISALPITSPEPGVLVCITHERMTTVVAEDIVAARSFWHHLGKVIEMVDDRFPMPDEPDPRPAAGS